MMARNTGLSMIMNNCKECGKPIRLRAFKIRINGKNGVVNYIEHMDGEKMHSNEWEAVMFKPYPKKEEDRPATQMINRWNSENA